MTPSGHSQPVVARPRERDSLVDILDRILDKGLVVAGDISINLLDIELLTIKIRLLIASVDKAREMGIDWWQNDPHFNSRINQEKAALKHEQETHQLQERIDQLEDQLGTLLQQSAQAPPKEIRGRR